MLNKLFSKTYSKDNLHIIYNILGLKLSVKDETRYLQIENSYLREIISETIGVSGLPKAKGGLRKFQEGCLDSLKLFDKLCRENNVQYWLDFGTLLGAVRHKGFIPWDDDIDVSMLKSDLDNILPLLEKVYENTDFVVRKRATDTNRFQIRIKHKDCNMGFDIFPVYEYNKSEISDGLREQISEKVRVARNKLNELFPQKYMSDDEILNAQNKIKEITNEIVLDNNMEIPQSPILFHGIEFPYEEDYFVMPNDEIFPLKEMQFEDITCPCPNKSEEYLTNIFGEWQGMPKRLVKMEHYETEINKNGGAQ